MLYDEKSGRLIIDCHEMVTVARRGISAHIPFDEDEPSISSPKRIMRALLPDYAEQTLCYGFSAGGFDFELTADAFVRNAKALAIACEIDSSPAKPRREEAAQARGEAFIAAYALSELSGGADIEIRIIYVNPKTGEQAEHTELATRKRLVTFFNKCVCAVSVFAKPEAERATVRLPSLRDMKFPYPAIREGQREFIRTAYRSICRGGRLYASAPTGTGKTVSALYPALRAMGGGKVDKVFYLTPKTTTADAARDCLELMRERGAVLKAILLSSKERSCSSGLLCRKSKRLCKNSACNRLAEAVIELYNSGVAVVTRELVGQVAERLRVCPYELSLAYSELCDVVICDLNYLFSPTVYIRRFFDKGGRFAFLIDEAHNLSDRVREAYSAELSDDFIGSMAECELLGPLSPLKKISREAKRVFVDSVLPLVKDEVREDKDGKRLGAANTKEPPLRLYSLLDELRAAAENELLSQYSAEDEEKDARISVIRDYLHTLKGASDILSRFDDSYEMFVFFDEGKIRIKLFCLDTADIVRERLSKGHSAVLFSATLSPLHYYRAILGGQGQDEMLEVGSPFDPSQLSVSIMDKISTRYSEREDTLGAVVRAIAAAVSTRRGNYMVFSPSLAYSEALAELFRKKYPKIKTISQRKNMTPREREEFLEALKSDDKSYLIAFSVMGGIYSEGIDLAGESLIGAIIVGIGMPGLSYEREAMSAYFQDKYEEGKQYAYIYPGMNRVFQAAGRVIRREDDRGIIVLIDDRFDDPIYRKSLPALWHGVKFIGDAKALKARLEQFWQEADKR